MQQSDNPTLRFIPKFFSCDICNLLKSMEEGMDRCRECNTLQCNDCSNFNMEGTKITITCAKCGAFIGSGTPDYISEEDREKLK